MTPYLYILGGVGIFLVAAAMVNIVFINWFRYSYAKNYIFFTSKNKIGFSASEVRSQSLWGQVQRRFSFRSSAEINDNNLRYAEKFVQELFDQLPNQTDIPNDGIKPYIFSNVEYSKLIDFIRNINRVGN